MTADWYLMRACGVVALVLLTVTTCLGVANVARLGRNATTRLVAGLVHRNASLLAVVFIGVHVVTAIADRYVSVPLAAVVVPGMSGYDPLWVGLGAAALDCIAAVVVTALLRGRMRPRSWKLVHRLAYLSWPLALVHGIGAGSGSGADTGATWSTVVYLSCGAAFAVAVAGRLHLRRARRTGRPQPPQSRPAVATERVALPV